MRIGDIELYDYNSDNWNTEVGLMSISKPFHDSDVTGSVILDIEFYKCYLFLMI